MSEWTSVEENMKLSIREIADNWQLSSASNRNINFKNSAFHILLSKPDNSEIMTLAAFKTKELAEAELTLIKKHLKLELVTK